MASHCKRKRPKNNIDSLASTKKSKINGDFEIILNNDDDEKSADCDPIMAIKELLAKVEPVGAYSVGGISLELPVLPGLFVKNHGIVPLPLNETQAKQLIKACKQAPFGLNEQTLVDKKVTLL